MMLTMSILILLLLFILNLTFGIKYGFGFQHYWFFETLHFLSGFFLAMFLSGFFDSKILIFTGIAIASSIWESAEYLIEKIPKLSAGFKKFSNAGNADLRLKWQDTLLDVILNFSGAAIFAYFVL